MEAKQNIREKLRLAFPGSYGDYLSLHFGKYLGEPLDTPEKEEAYRKMVSFLDGLQLKEISPELEQYLTQTMEPLPPQMWKKVDAAGQEAAVDPSGYLERHGEQLRESRAVDANKGISNFSCGTNESTSGGFFEQQWLLQYFFTEFTDSRCKSYRTYIGQLEQANAVFLRWMEEQKLFIRRSETEKRRRKHAGRKKSICSENRKDRVFLLARLLLW